MNTVTNPTKAKIGLMAASFIMIAYMAPTAMIAQMAESFPEHPLSLVQMIATIPGLTGLVVAILNSWLTRKFYKRHLIIASAVIHLASGIPPIFFHDNLYFLLACACVMGIGFGLQLTNIASLITECFDQDQSRFLMGLQATVICGGAMIFNFLAGFLGKEEWHRSYIAFVLIVVVLILELLYLPKGNLEAKRSEGLAEGEKSKAKIPGVVWFIGVLGFVVYVFIAVYNSNVSVMVELRNFGSTQESSYAAALYMGAGAIAGIFAGPLIKKMHLRIYVLLMLLMALGFIVSFFSSNLVLLCIGGMLAGGAYAMFNATSNFFAADLSGGRNTSMCLSVFSSLANLGMAISPIIISFIMMPLSIEGRFGCTGIVFAVLVLAVLLCLGRIYKLQKHQ